MKFPPYAHYIGENLFSNLLNLLVGSPHKHIALLGPRQGGKSLVLEELIQRARLKDESVRPFVVTLADDALKKLSHDAFVLEVAKKLEVSTIPKWSIDTPLSGKLERLFRVAAKGHRTSLWLFVRDILGFSAPVARELLHAFQLCAEDHFLRERIAVVVTGSADFLPLTYGDMSPYRHAERFLVYGLDKPCAEEFYCRRRIRQRGHIGILRGARGATVDIRREINKDAFAHLYKETGGNPHLLQEIVVTACRHPYTLQEFKLYDTWNLEQTKACIDNFRSIFMPSDFYCRMTIKEIEHKNDSFDLLLEVLQKGDSKVTIPSSRPHHLEVCGLIRRDDRHKAYIASPIWRRFLEEELRDQLVADAYAWQHRWEKVWKHYEELSQDQRDRPVSDRATYRLRSVLSAWDDSVMDQVGNGPDAVWKQFAPGAQYLLGFDSGMILNVLDSSGNPLCFGKPLKEKDLAFSQLKEVPIHNSAGGRGNRSYWLDEDRLRLYSDPHIALRWPPETYPALFLRRSGYGRTVDTAEQERLWRSLDSFWHAYETAHNMLYEKEIGALHQRHLDVIDDVNKCLTEDPFDMGRVVQFAADALVDKAGYYRVLICLVGPKREHIQGVASKCRDADFNFDAGTNYSLTERKSIKKRDIQAWVVLKEKMCVLKNGQDRKQENPKSNVEQAKRLRMLAVTVVPMMVGKEVIGTIHFERQDKREPSEAERNLFTTFAGQLAVIFHQAKRMTLLQRSMSVLKDQIRIVDSCRKVLFLNTAAAEQAAGGWQKEPWNCRCPGAIERKCLIDEIENGQETAQTYHMDDKGEERQPSEWLMAPIDDFRSTLLPPFKADGRIGYIERVHDLKDLYDLVKAFQRWLATPGLRPRARKVLDFFQKQGFRWCRIYLKKEREDDSVILESLEEYGLQDETNKARFCLGQIQFRREDKDPLPWYVIDVTKDLSIYELQEERKSGKIKPANELYGLPRYFVKEIQFRKELEKDDKQWLEAPLRLGERIIGKMVFAMPKSLSPLQWQLLRNALTGAAAAIDEARAAETAAAQAEEIWKTASNHAVHQLANKLGPLESFAYYIREDLDNNRILRVEHFEQMEKGLREAREILSEFKRYASDKPFDDVTSLSSTELLDLARERVSLQHKNIQGRIVKTVTKTCVDTSPKAMREVFDILSDNSAKHGGGVSQIVIKVSLHQATPEYLKIEYRDNGKGIPKQDKEKVFRPYHSSDPKGTGLGLSIARRYIERHGGKIIEEGEYEKGVCFTLYVPISKTEGGSDDRRKDCTYRRR